MVARGLMQPLRGPHGRRWCSSCPAGCESRPGLRTVIAGQEGASADCKSRSLWRLPRWPQAMMLAEVAKDRAPHAPARASPQGRTGRRYVQRSPRVDFQPADSPGPPAPAQMVGMGKMLQK
ncbi:hypothetical protein NDU88_003587 [Pleurodeles waltl]|uniref:Uncharacterized protein n=1 Tax=Pleurodeles waltl TaxID=8319 RepID=A0AAV7L4A5_PLEWA|nr:hypothetical protein NDU88_003587 [Pleurodeles waltl]